MPEPTDEELGPLWERLKNEVIAVHLQWQQFRALYASSASNIELLNRSAAGFFALLRQTLVRDVFLSIARLTDPVRMGKHTNLTLDHLLGLPGMADASQQRERLTTLIANIQEHAAPIREHRHTYIAHLDLEKVVSPDARPLPGVSIEMVDATLAAIADAMNTVALHLRETTIAFDDIIQNGDPRALLGRLRDAQRWRDHYFAAMKEGIG